MVTTITMSFNIDPRLKSVNEMVENERKQQYPVTATLRKPFK